VFLDHGCQREKRRFVGCRNLKLGFATGLPPIALIQLPAPCTVRILFAEQLGVALACALEANRPALTL